VPWPNGDAWLRVKVCQKLDLLTAQVRVREVIGGEERETQFPVRIEDLRTEGE
jgi:hypothetical protein